MSSIANAEKVHDAWNGFNHGTALRVWVRRWTHWDGCGTVLWSDDIFYVYMPFVRFEEKYEYAAQLTAVSNLCYSLSGDNLPSSGIHYISWVPPHDEIYFFDSLRCEVREITLQRLHWDAQWKLGSFLGVKRHGVLCHSTKPSVLVLWDSTVLVAWVRKFESFVCAYTSAIFLLF